MSKNGMSLGGKLKIHRERHFVRNKKKDPVDPSEEEKLRAACEIALNRKMFVNLLADSFRVLDKRARQNVEASEEFRIIEYSPSSGMPQWKEFEGRLIVLRKDHEFFRTELEKYKQLAERKPENLPDSPLYVATFRPYKERIKFLKPDGTPTVEYKYLNKQRKSSRRVLNTSESHDLCRVIIAKAFPKCKNIEELVKAENEAAQKAETELRSMYVDSIRALKEQESQEEARKRLQREVYE